MLDEAIGDSIPLTSSEKRRKQELETIVSSGLEEFLRVGSALAELRNRRLYRVEFGTFEEYARVRFGMARSSLDQLIRSASTAQCLLEAGVQLPKGTTEAVIRPLSSLPGDATLRVACWELARIMSPKCGPTQPLVSRLCRTIRNVIDQVEEPSQTPRKRSAESLQRETPFVRPLLRLSSWQGFSLELVLSHAEKLDSAKSLYQACDTMRERCRLVQERLAANYPELTSHA
jgi:hypothetical protein